jgi:8-oxo-dGTP pyrophosphatase MutT (NUDIX family)
MPKTQFNALIAACVSRYRSETADRDEHLSLLRWQLDEGHALESRETYPGHITTSAIILSADGRQTLLIDHQTLKRWLQPGGHYEPAAKFWHSAAREAMEETGLLDPPLHPWHGGEDRPFLIDSHEVPGKASRGERPHVHHDLQFLFVADPAATLTAQADEVNAARWFPVSALSSVTPRGLARLIRLGIVPTE